MSDFDVRFEQLKQRKLEEALKMFPPVKEKTKNFEINVFKAIEEGKRTCYLESEGTDKE